jgi:hypothetical protein
LNAGDCCPGRNISRDVETDQPTAWGIHPIGPGEYSRTGAVTVIEIVLEDGGISTGPIVTVSAWAGAESVKAIAAPAANGSNSLNIFNCIGLKTY